ncbi:hypothetical protein M8C21_002778, partial [Ambrosia artemisiifolia]
TYAVFFTTTTLPPVLGQPARQVRWNAFSGVASNGPIQLRLRSVDGGQGGGGTPSLGGGWWRRLSVAAFALLWRLYLRVDVTVSLSRLGAVVLGFRLEQEHVIASTTPVVAWMLLCHRNNVSHRIVSPRLYCYIQAADIFSNRFVLVEKLI